MNDDLQIFCNDFTSLQIFIVTRQKVIFEIRKLILKSYLCFASRYTGDSGAKNMAQIKAQIGTKGAKMAICFHRNANPKAYTSKHPKHRKTLSSRE